MGIVLLRSLLDEKEIVGKENQNSCLVDLYVVVKQRCERNKISDWNRGNKKPFDWFLLLLGVCFCQSRNLLKKQEKRDKRIVGDGLVGALIKA